jgi:subtilisin family serine protease
VSGIAAAAWNNSLGFVGAGGESSIWAYRVFPTPDDTCAGDSGDDQCSADTADIASAIKDAVSNGAKVISLSLGGGNCVTPSGNNPSGDSDFTEGTAIQNAISHNVIVVAAAGNGGTAGLSAPACDTGVIAVGATSLDDGQRNESGHTVGTQLTPIEYVASYSQWGSPASNLNSISAWGIVAPGGDPYGPCTTQDNCDPDELHWIQNIWTTTPFQSGPTDYSFTAYRPPGPYYCTNDYPNDTLTTSPDCRTEIAGTSMATPHVAGAVALILAATGTSGPYATPSKMKELLCTTADDIRDPHQGCGRLNIYRAMAKALNDPILP